MGSPLLLNCSYHAFSVNYIDFLIALETSELESERLLWFIAFGLPSSLESCRSFLGGNVGRRILLKVHKKLSHSGKINWFYGFWTLNYHNSGFFSSSFSFLALLFVIVGNLTWYELRYWFPILLICFFMKLSWLINITKQK